MVCVRVYFEKPIALNYKYIFLGSLCYYTVKLLVELLDLVLMVCGWCIDLNDCDALWSG